MNYYECENVQKYFTTNENYKFSVNEGNCEQNNKFLEAEEMVPLFFNFNVAKVD